CSQFFHGNDFRRLSFDLCSFYLATKRTGAECRASARMSNVRFRKARQSYPREVAARHYGIAGVTTELGLPTIEKRIADERWEFGDPYADVTQAGISLGNERDSRPATNNLCVDGERPGSVSGSHRRVRKNCEK